MRTLRAILPLCHAQPWPTLCDPHGLQPTRLLCPWYSPGKNTGVGCHFLLQGIFLTQGSNLHLLCLLHGQADSLPLSCLGSPKGHFIQPLIHITWPNSVALNTLEKFLQIDESKLTDKKTGGGRKPGRASDVEWAAGGVMVSGLSPASPGSHDGGQCRQCGISYQFRELTDFSSTCLNGHQELLWLLLV